MDGMRPVRLRALRLFLVAACLVVGSPWSLDAASVQDFPYRAEIVKGRWSSLVMAEIPPSVLARSDTLLSGCRLFDDHGREVPFVVHSPGPPRGSDLPWEIVSVKGTEEGVTYLLRRTGGELEVNGIDIIPEKGFYCADAEVYAGILLDVWQLMGRGRISDLRPVRDLSSTRVDLSRTRSTELKVVLRPVVDLPDLGSCLRVPSGDMTVPAIYGPHAVGVRFRSMEAMSDGMVREFDGADLRDFRSRQDEQGDTIIDLGRLDLPVHQVVIRADAAPCFYREVEVLTSHRGDDSSYEHRASGAMCSIPVLGIYRATIGTEIGKAGFMRIRIMNQGSPPVVVREIGIRWPRLTIVFQPGKGRSYGLYCGAPAVPAVQSGDAAGQAASFGRPFRGAVWKVEGPGENPAFRPSGVLGREYRPFLVIGMVFLVGYILGSLFVLVRRYMNR